MKSLQHSSLGAVNSPSCVPLCFFQKNFISIFFSEPLRQHVVPLSFFTTCATCFCLEPCLSQVQVISLTLSSIPLSTLLSLSLAVRLVLSEVQVFCILLDSSSTFNGAPRFTLSLISLSINPSTSFLRTSILPLWVFDEAAPTEASIFVFFLLQQQVSLYHFLIPESSSFPFTYFPL